jgi:crotonobetainyl-CoA:carnitine CoA-transferase CaiB-like acyl-CoA transferase
MIDNQWSIVQDTAAAARDPQARANGLIGSFWGADGETRELVASPALFDGQAPVLSRAPGFAEHTDEVLREIGKSAAEIVQLQESGVVTRAPQHA